MEITTEDSAESICCRICQTSTSEDIIAPCLCKGSLRFVHRPCLEHWLTSSGRRRCEICYYRFSVCLHRRYNCFESVCAWSSYPDVLITLRTDCVLIAALTVFMFSLSLAWFLILKLTIVPRLHQVSPREDIMRDFLVALVVSTLFIYLCAVVFIAKDHVGPWYNWWRSNCCIKLLSGELIVPDNHKQCTNCDETVESKLEATRV